MAQTSFTLQLISFSTPLEVREPACEKIRKILPEWEKITQKRLQQLETTRPEDYAEIFQDIRVVNSYTVVSMRIRQELSGFCKGRYVLLLSDQKGCIQGIATLIEKVDSLYVSNLLSASRNTKMHGQNSPEHQLLAVKGAGTTLMQKICELAKALHKPKVELQATENSETFYKQQLKMQYHIPTDTYYFDIEE